MLPACLYDLTDLSTDAIYALGLFARIRQLIPGKNEKFEF